MDAASSWRSLKVQTISWLNIRIPQLGQRGELLLEPCPKSILGSSADSASAIPVRDAGPRHRAKLPGRDEAMTKRDRTDKLASCRVRT
jgi:hypothetical protein